MKFCPRCQRQYSDLENVCPVDDAILYLQDLFHLVGCTIANQYIVERLTGIGGMSAVYRAYHKRMERPVALKILLPHLTLNDPEMVRLFEREARAAGQINHPNIATIYDSGRTSEDLIYLVMEWLEGHTLEKVLRQNAPLDWESTALILQQITKGLEAAHGCRIIHRDLKPGNIMIVPQPFGPMQVKILDFGVAKIASSDTGNFVSAPLGTVHYASPEQMLPGNQIDQRTDLYALGVMLYEMLTGHLPFAGTSVADLVRQHLHDPPLPLSVARPDAPPAIVTLLEEMLAKQSKARPPDALTVWQRFEHALHEAQLIRSESAPRRVSELSSVNRTASLPSDLPEEIQPEALESSSVNQAIPETQPVYSSDLPEEPFDRRKVFFSSSEPDLYETPLGLSPAQPFRPYQEEFDVRALLTASPTPDADAVNAIGAPKPQKPRPRQSKHKLMLALAALLALVILLMSWKKTRPLAFEHTIPPSHSTKSVPGV